MNRQQKREFNRKNKNISAEEVNATQDAAELISSMEQCHKCKATLDKKNQCHLDNWRISVIDEKMLLTCDKCQ